MITAIFKIKTTLPEMAAECLNLFGEGARLDDAGINYWFALNNTEPQNGFVRMPVAPHIAAALQWMEDNDITSDHADLIKVEWHGQDIEAWPDDELVETPFQVGMTEEIILEDETVIPPRPIYLARFAV